MVPALIKLVSWSFLASNRNIGIKRAEVCLADCLAMFRHVPCNVLNSAQKYMYFTLSLSLISNEIIQWKHLAMPAPVLLHSVKQAPRLK